MQVSIICTASPPLTQWVTVLVDRGWKLIAQNPTSLTAKRQLGQSEYPKKNTTVWYLSLTETGEPTGEIEAEIDVPAFSDSPFSQLRIYEEFAELADRIEGVETQEELELDILTEVRE